MSAWRLHHGAKAPTREPAIGRRTHAASPVQCAKWVVIARPTAAVTRRHEGQNACKWSETSRCDSHARDAPAILALIVTLAGCGDMAKLPVEAGTGPTPELPAPTSALIPTVNVAAAKGWPEGLMPAPIAGAVVTAFARDLDHPRWIHVLPNGDVLVAETNAPPKPDDSKGVKAWFMKLFMKRAGAASASANRITLLRDADGDGVAELRFAFLEGLNSPFGMVLVGQDLYVADSDAIRRFPYIEGATRVTNSGAKIVDLPGGPLNHHWTKSLIASEDGKFLYVGVGSNSNVAENGMDMEKDRAAVLQVDYCREELSSIRDRLAQSCRVGVGAGHQNALDGCERA